MGFGLTQPKIAGRNGGGEVQSEDYRTQSGSTSTGNPESDVANLQSAIKVRSVPQYPQSAVVQQTGADRTAVAPVSARGEVKEGLRVVMRLNQVLQVRTYLLDSIARHKSMSRSPLRDKLQFGDEEFVSET